MRNVLFVRWSLGPRRHKVGQRTVGQLHRNGEPIAAVVPEEAVELDRLFAERDVIVATSHLDGLPLKGCIAVERLKDSTEHADVGRHPATTRPRQGKVAGILSDDRRSAVGGKTRRVLKDGEIVGGFDAVGGHLDGDAEHLARLEL